jgi:hypothetical protein
VRRLAALLASSLRIVVLYNDTQGRQLASSFYQSWIQMNTRLVNEKNILYCVGMLETAGILWEACVTMLASTS